MKGRIKFGLIVGGIGLVLNVCVSAAMGICGPFLSMACGGIAGFLANRDEKTTRKAEGGKVGAVAGAIAGALTLLGQMLGGIGILVYMQQSGGSTLFGAPPPPGTDASLQAAYYLSGLGIGLCFGLLGIALAAAAGGGIGYLTTTEQPQVTSY